MRNIIIISLLLFVCCIFQVRNYDKTEQNSSFGKRTEADTTITNPKQSEIPRSDFKPYSYSVEEWIGKEFIVLPKQQMFRNFGYELYFDKDFENSTLPIDPAVQLKNHRIKLESIAEHTLVGKEIEDLNGETLVTFADQVTGKEIYAKTYKKAVKEIAFKEDLENAKKKWLGKVVFSRRGMISIIENDNGFGSQKVRIEDSLIVYDIRWGVTPLPVNPLWLMVETVRKTKGFIPVRVSWSNVMNDLPKEGDPWEEDIFESDPKLLFNWESNMWDLINNHRVTKEMNRDQVLVSWGKPLEKYKKDVNGDSLECWKYQSQVVYFGSKSIIKIEDK